MKLSLKKTLLRVVLPGAIVLISIFSVFAKEDFELKRRQMMLDVQQMTKMSEPYTGIETMSQTVADAMLTVPRHKFIPKSQRRYAYENRALPITHSQTISQPYIVALMTELAAVNSDSIVLEVGTGSGYQAAVLSEIVNHVYSIEIIEPLGLATKSLLKDLGYDNITVNIGDGYFGWPEHAPFDAILVTAAAPHVPEALLEQLKPGGRLVIPVGASSLAQSLKLFIKGSNGEIQEQEILPVAFVPLTGEH